MQYANWGLYPRVEGYEYAPQTPRQAAEALHRAHKCIGRGLGRSYGDASLGPEMLRTTGMNRILDFDAGEGRLTAEAGLSIAEILRHFVPRGWFVPVTPGTKFVTLGGAVAADVHGKNHHREGSFGRHVQWLRLLDAQGEARYCSRRENPALFEATCGGMGLTGIILEVCLQLKPIETAYIRQTTYKAPDLAAIFRLFEQTQDWTYSVAWIDCLARGRKLGRSVLMVGEHATPDQLSAQQARQPLRIPSKPQLRMPFYLPSFTLNKLSVAAFNKLFYAKHRHRHTDIIPYEPFFYPLDSILHWNRMYGRRGFVQYQFVLPLENSFEGMQDILERIARRGQASFLAVLKLFGRQDDMVSFPMEGYTLALDFAVNPRLLAFLDELDEVVARYGGRIYLAKDARMKAGMLRRGYPGLERFCRLRDRFDPQHRFASALSERLEL